MKLPREVTKARSREEIAVIPAPTATRFAAAEPPARLPPFGGQLVVRFRPQDTNLRSTDEYPAHSTHFGGPPPWYADGGARTGSTYPGKLLDAVRLRMAVSSTWLSAVRRTTARSTAWRRSTSSTRAAGGSAARQGRRAPSSAAAVRILISGSALSREQRRREYWRRAITLPGPPNEEVRPGPRAPASSSAATTAPEIFSSDLGGDFVLGGGIRAATTFSAQARYFNKINDNTRIDGVAAIGRDLSQLLTRLELLRLTATPFSARAEVAHKSARMLDRERGIDILHAPSISSSLRARSVWRVNSGPGLNSPQRSRRRRTAARTRWRRMPEFEVQLWTAAASCPASASTISSSRRHRPAPPAGTCLRVSLGAPGAHAHRPKTMRRAASVSSINRPSRRTWDFVFGRPNLVEPLRTATRRASSSRSARTCKCLVEGFAKAPDGSSCRTPAIRGDGRAHGRSGSFAGRTT